jgi:RNA polymerase sigma factor (sigma-70 family)
MMTELTEMAIRAKEEPGILDNIVLKWQDKIRLEGWVRSKTLQMADAQDLKQEILINIVERFGEYNPELGAFETWAYNRARQIARSWIRVKATENKPVIKKGFHGESTRGQIGPIPEGGIENIEQSRYDEGFEEHIQFVDMAIASLDMQESNRDITRKTFEEMADICGRLGEKEEGRKVTRQKLIKEVSNKLGISKTKAESNIRRIQKAYRLLEDAMIHA